MGLWVQVIPVVPTGNSPDPAPSQRPGKAPQGGHGSHWASQSVHPLGQTRHPQGWALGWSRAAELLTCQTRSRHTRTCRRCSRSRRASRACSAGSREPAGREGWGMRPQHRQAEPSGQQTPARRLPVAEGPSPAPCSSQPGQAVLARPVIACPCWPPSHCTQQHHHCSTCGSASTGQHQGTSPGRVWQGLLVCPDACLPCWLLAPELPLLTDTQPGDRVYNSPGHSSPHLRVLRLLSVI